MKNNKNNKVTIYDLARELGIAPSSVSKALNDLPTISDKIKTLVNAKAKELNYIHNSNAANLRRGSSRTIGVIVPKINTTFFSDAISGIEEVCSKNKHNLIICQSDEFYEKEVESVETLIGQNVDCILISLSMETKSFKHLQRIINLNLNLIQFDRVSESVPSHSVVNDNKDAAYKAVKHLIKMGYTKIALLGGPHHLTIYKDRKEGYLKAMNEAQLNVPYNYILENTLTMEKGMQVASELLKSKLPPDAFFAVSDYSALGAIKAATLLGLKIPEEVGIMGFSNDTFTGLINPGLSSVDQNCRQLGSDAVGIYFDDILGKNLGNKYKKKVVKSSLIIRKSSLKKD
ncbi:MAG: LacI family DNA-binding transcriptional regulator [Ginsengibacter sp.]